MRCLIPALVVTVVGFSSAHAEPAKTSPFSNKSFGDGNGYKHPDADVGQYFETKPQRPAELKPERPHVPAKVSPEHKPAAATASRPRPRPFAPVVSKTGAPSRTVSAQTETAPLSAPPSVNPPAAPVAGAGAEGGVLDSASEEARRDYETRLF